MDTATKTGIDAAKTASKRVVQKTAGATGDLIENKIADKITSIRKPKEKEKTKEVEEIYIPTKKRQQIIDDLDYFEYKLYFFCIKMEFQKITIFLDITSDNKDLPKFVTKKWIEVYDQSQGNYDVDKEIRIKTSMIRSDLSDVSDVYIVAKGTITVVKKYILLLILRDQIIQILMQLILIIQIILRLVKKNWFLKIMHHL